MLRSQHIVANCKLYLMSFLTYLITYLLVSFWWILL